jgi:two-component system catabolic regulation response regulator CreB
VTYRIVVVEDEPAIAESVAYSLERDGHSVATAGTIAEARELCFGTQGADPDHERNAGVERGAAIDLIVLDLILPDGDGMELLREIRAAGQQSAVIVLSSRDAEADRVTALEIGADDYVTKPFSPREVVARVRAVLRRTSGSAFTEGTRTTIPLRVDRDSRRAMVQNHTLELTRVEFDLLAALADTPGRVFTRAQLIDTVWGDGFALSDRTVDSHVKLLRRKIVEVGGNPDWIETVRGVGYRMMDEVPLTRDAGGNGEP